MPEENWAVHGGIAACDSCHARKVKCDRNVPCGTCIAAEIPCLRTRQKQKPRARLRTDDKIRALVEKVSSLENAISDKTSQTPCSAEDTDPAQRPPGDSIGSPRPPKRQRNGDFVPAQEFLSPPDSVTSHRQRNNEARDFIQKELSHNDRLVAHQRSVLQTAVDFVDQLSQSAPVVEDSVWTQKVPVDLAQGELIQIILANQRKEELQSSDIQLHTLDHIPPHALERMAVGLLEAKADERTLNMYKVIVHFKSALTLYASQLQVPQSSTRDHIRQAQFHHLSAAFTALDNVSFMTPPSLLLLQTILTGAVLSHIIGNSSSCWSLTAYASRTLVALGYHNICESVPISESSEEQEIHVAVAWCYQFDRLMSLLLLRPPSLPPLGISVSKLVKLDANNLMSVFASIMLEMVPIHEKILELTLGGSSSRHTSAHPSIASEIEHLRIQMSRIHIIMEKACPPNPGEMSADFLLHWQSLEFKFYSTLTSVHRLSPTVTSDPKERELCLESARKALGYVKQIEHLGRAQGHFVAEYSPYLSWTVLSYPLTPFFVLFCNIVSTSNMHDFNLLQDVVASITSLVAEVKYAEKLHRLCNTLLALCRPLVQSSVAQDPLDVLPAHPSLPIDLDVLAALPATAADAGIHPVEGLSTWNDDLMWQLFQCQPSLDWYNSDILDAAVWDVGS